MAAVNQTKKQRIDEAREAARLAREKREKRQRTMKVLVPTLVSLGVILLVAVVVAVIALQPKAAVALPGGPKNMASNGILYVQKGSEAQYVPTPGLKKGQKPVAPATGDAPVKVQTYVDLTCEACKAFEGQNATQLEQMVADGKISLEIKPVAILQGAYTSDYPDRAANLAACVANYAPSGFLDALVTLYKNQGTEQTPGLSNDRMISLIRSAGVRNDRVESCIRGGSFRSWVTSATQLATSDPNLQGPQGFATPTVTVNGKLWDRQNDIISVINRAAQG
ncbi:MAG: thioredoxin domain-containing protein [Micrococcales bacterium]|nr:thioredoxin domain-containing protein [Micrococcales bacterium]